MHYKGAKRLGIRKLDLLIEPSLGSGCGAFLLKMIKLLGKCDQRHNNGAKMGGWFIKNQRDRDGVSLELSLERHVQRSGSTKTGLQFSAGERRENPFL